MFQLTEPAAHLFSDFAELSKTVTRHQYAKHLELEFTGQNLMSSEEILRESAASAEANAMVRKYYGGVNISLKPLLTTEQVPPTGDDAIAKWREAQNASGILRAEAEKISAECVEQQTRLMGFISAHRLTKAGFKIEPKEFGLPENATSVAKQEIAARFATGDASAAIMDRLTKLEPFMVVLRRRVTLALRLAQSNRGASDPDGAGEVVELARLLAAVGAELPRAREIGSKLNALMLLARNRGNHSDPGAVDMAASELAAELRAVTDGIQQRLKQFPYPFPHARGRLTVAEYARFEKSTGNNLQRVYLDGNAHVERLFALNYRLIGRILAPADAAETSLEKQ